jgi:putative FmdB family regulatory protein
VVGGGALAVPLYEYQCPKCGRFELIRKFSDELLTKCPTCGSDVQKLLSAPAIQFKGTGWYITDYARKSDGKDGKDGKGESSKSKGEGSKSEGSKSEGSKSEGSKSEGSKDSGSSSESKSTSSTASSSSKDSGGKT